MKAVIPNSRVVGPRTDMAGEGDWAPPVDGDLAGGELVENLNVYQNSKDIPQSPNHAPGAVIAALPCEQIRENAR